MSVSTVDWKLETTGDGSTTTYTCAFPVMRIVDVKVYVDDVLQTRSRDYTITGIVVNSRNHVDAGFQVVFTEAPASGAEIYIRRQTPRHNSNKLYKGDKFQLPVFENNYDNLTMMFQEIGGLSLEGYSGPIDEDVPPTGYNPTLSGFYPAKIVSAVSGNQYVIRSVQATPSGGWKTVSFPILDETAADINQRTDHSAGDIVLAKPLEDNAGGLAWRIVGNEDCAQTVTPPYAGTYLEIERCDYTGTDEVAWVRSDEFSTGDEFMINGVCYTVLSTGTPPGPEFVVRLADTTAYADCATCLLSQDPDAPDPPLLPTRYKKMARCSDDSKDDYSIPTEYFGVPTNHDLDLIYKVDGICYYVSDEEEGSPSNPLFPVHAADSYVDCPTCIATFCDDCASKIGSPPEAPIVSNHDDGGGAACCEVSNTTMDNISRITLSYGGGPEACGWQTYNTGLGTTGPYINIYWCSVTGTFEPVAGTPVTYEAGKWYIEHRAVQAGGRQHTWYEEAPNITCDLATGKPYGTHIFTTDPVDSPPVCANSCITKPLVIIPQ